jgi:hypothetical protein
MDAGDGADSCGTGSAGIASGKRAKWQEAFRQPGLLRVPRPRSARRRRRPTAGATSASRSGVSDVRPEPGGRDASVYKQGSIGHAACGHSKVPANDSAATEREEHSAFESIAEAYSGSSSHAVHNASVGRLHADPPERRSVSTKPAATAVGSGIGSPSSRIPRR